jgi:hypothetical protein
MIIFQSLVRVPGDSPVIQSIQPYINSPTAIIDLSTEQIKDKDILIAIGRNMEYWDSIMNNKANFIDVSDKVEEGSKIWFSAISKMLGGWPDKIVKFFKWFK